MRYKIKGLLALLYFCMPLILIAQVPKDIDSFNKLPTSIAKDYYIYRYLTEKNITSSDAEKLLGQTKRVTKRMFYLFAKKMDDPGFKKVSKCLRLGIKKLLKEDTECKAIGLNVYKALKLKKKQLEDLSIELKAYKKLSSTLKILSSEDVYEEAYKNQKKFIGIFNSSGKQNRKKIFDKILNPKYINELCNYKRFNTSLRLIVMEKNLSNLKVSLLEINNTKKLNDKSLFLLGLNALKLNQEKKALFFINESEKKAKYRFDRDKTTFWKYLITKDEKYIDKLMKSFDVNIYTIFAHEQRNKKFTNILYPHVNNKTIKYNIENPFLWTELLREIKDKNDTQLLKISEKFKYKNTIGQYTFIKERIDHYQNSYFPIPFKNLLENYDKKRISTILAIARQESRFIPASVSTSYALGMMQFMPFLAHAIAKKEKMKDFDLDDMFYPKIAYNFANIHLNFLSRHLHNPLFIAYAYNGGIGYTRRLLKSGTYFRKGRYEPFLSMELINYPETRRYGKKVLANYVIYMQLLGEKVTLHEIIAQVDNFYDNMLSK